MKAFLLAASLVFLPVGNSPSEDFLVLVGQFNVLADKLAQGHDTSLECEARMLTLDAGISKFNASYWEWVQGRASYGESELFSWLRETFSTLRGIAQDCGEGF